jgi:hypothetical protein
MIQINPETLKAFSSVTRKRMPKEFVRKIIEEGLQIPVYLEDLLSLRAFHYRSN